MPKLSNTTKMQIKGKRVRSWSLNAGITCPGSHDSPVCEGCYAKKGMYRFPVVKDARTYNRQDYHKADWCDRMVAKVKRLDYFRWFDSGDIETVELATKIYEVIKRTPSVKHWLPTRSDKLSKLAKVIDSIDTLPNVSVRRSADNIGIADNLERPNVISYVIKHDDIPNATALGIHICPATTSAQTSCNTCTMCYTSKPVAYLVH